MTTKQKRQRALLTIMREGREKVKFAGHFCENLAEMSQELSEMDMDSHMVEMDEEDYLEMEKEPGGEDAVRSALRSAVMAIFDADESVDVTVGKIKTLLSAGAAVKEMEELPEGEEGEETLEGEGDMMESVQKVVAKVVGEAVKPLREHIQKLETKVTGKTIESDLEELIESNQRESNPERIALLRDIPAEARKGVIESWPAVQRESRERPPRSPGKNSGATAPGSYQEARQKVRALKDTK